MPEEKFESEMPQTGTWDVAKDLKDLEGIVAKLEKNKQPLPDEAKTAFAELQAAGENVKKQLEALLVLIILLKEIFD